MSESYGLMSRRRQHRPADVRADVPADCNPPPAAWPIRSRSRDEPGSRIRSMDILFITSVAVIAPDSERSRALYMDTLGLPLEGEPGDYLHSERIDGAKHFGVWPLSQASQACFGTTQWPADHPVPQASIEFE